MSERIECSACNISVLPQNWPNHLLGARHYRNAERAPARGWREHFGVRHGVIDYDSEEEWLTESDLEGASRVVAHDVPDWFGRLVVAALSAESGGGTE